MTGLKRARTNLSSPAIKTRSYIAKSNNVSTGSGKTPSSEEKKGGLTVLGAKVIVEENKKLKVDLLNKTQEFNNLKKKIDLIDNLAPYEWLTDEPLQVYFVLINEMFPNFNNTIYIVNPSIAQSIRFSEDIPDILNPLDLQSKDIVLIPVNNSENLLVEGGSASLNAQITNTRRRHLG